MGREGQPTVRQMTELKGNYARGHDVKLSAWAAGCVSSHASRHGRHCMIHFQVHATCELISAVRSLSRNYPHRNVSARLRGFPAPPFTRYCLLYHQDTRHSDPARAGARYGRRVAPALSSTTHSVCCLRMPPSRAARYRCPNPECEKTDTVGRMCGHLLRSESVGQRRSSGRACGGSMCPQVGNPKLYDPRLPTFNASTQHPCGMSGRI